MFYSLKTYLPDMYPNIHYFVESELCINTELLPLVCQTAANTIFEVLNESITHWESITPPCNYVTQYLVTHRPNDIIYLGDVWIARFCSKINHIFEDRSYDYYTGYDGYSNYHDEEEDETNHPTFNKRIKTVCYKMYHKMCDMGFLTHPYFQIDIVNTLIVEKYPYLLSMGCTFETCTMSQLQYDLNEIDLTDYC